MGSPADVVIDPSVLVAIVLAEPDAESLLEHVRSTEGHLVMSAPGLLEAAMVVQSRQGPDATRDLQLLISGLAIQVVAVDDAVANAAVAAWRRFGKGRHPASLKFGDCLSYGLARTRGESLPFKGNDFAQTDLPAAW